MQTEKDTRQSLAFYFAFALLVGQFVANAALHVAFNYLFLSITGFIVIGLLFGPGFALDFFKIIRGSNREGGGSDDG